MVRPILSPELVLSGFDFGVVDLLIFIKGAQIIKRGHFNLKNLLRSFVCWAFHEGLLQLSFVVVKVCPCLGCLDLKVHLDHSSHILIFVLLLVENELSENQILIVEVILLHDVEHLS